MLLANNAVRQRLSSSRLAALVQAAAARHDWAGQVRYNQDERWYQRLEQGDNHEVWLLSWLPGQRTGFHDHCGSAGAFAVVQGELREYTSASGRGAGGRGTGMPTGSDFAAGRVRSFGPAHVHEVVNRSAGPAVSIHAYSPPLAGMRRYELTSSGLVLAAVETAGERW
jgi:predicted metal-dependent enzyme (double-stranded beta helix superfamily)